MKPTNFSKSLTDFLTSYLPGERGVSHNTILSYKDAFLLFIQYMQDQKGIKVNRLDFNVITKNCIVEYLDWLQKERGCGNSTRNSRLAAMHSFFRYLQYQYPEKIYECQKILSIPLKKKENPIINYLTLDGIKLLLEGPDLSTKRGRRDLALLSLMYDSAARVQEIIDLTPLMVRLDNPCIIKLIGKGAKARIVSLMDAQVKFLKDYIVENKLHEPYANKYPMFQNSRKEKLTRAGLNHILTKYAQLARKENPNLIPVKLSCHSLRQYVDYYNMGSVH